MQAQLKTWKAYGILRSIRFLPRELKAQLERKRASKFERRLVYVERNRILERARAGLNALRLKWAQLPLLRVERSW